MNTFIKINPFFTLTLVFLLNACSNVDSISSSSAQQLSQEVEVSQDAEDDTGMPIFRGPTISYREGFGTFTKGLLLGGGASFGNQVYLQAQKNKQQTWEFKLITSIQYTNLGGVYRRYDKAAIQGGPTLLLEVLSMDKQFTINSINMTETFSMKLEENFLRSKADNGFVLVIADNSGNHENLNIPATYVEGFLQAVDK